jgi:hypothetical protein
MPRKATWLILIWTGLWLYSTFSLGSDNCAGDQTCQAGVAFGIGIAAIVFFGIWLVGFIILAVAWFMTRPRNNVAVYGPDGQLVMVSESEGRKRVARGWTYRKPE